MSYLTIGKVAKSSGVSIETIRFYERKGIVDEPPRSLNGYRRYPEETVKRLKFIVRAKELGFTLKEIKELLYLKRETESKDKCAEVRSLAESKITEVHKKIEFLSRIEEILNNLVDNCRVDHEITDNCPILQVLDED